VVQVQLKLYGVFRSAANASSLTVEVPENEPTVKSAIERIFAQGEFGTLRSLLIDSTTSDPRPNALIMVSGREINTLRGLETELTEGDELALLPVAHGG
jgi:molybdopterin converting factor small subunit